MATYAYNLRQINLSLYGVPILAGGGTDGFISITTPQYFDSVDGVHGDGAHFRTGNTTGSFQLTLLQTSEYNVVLTSIVNVSLDNPLTNGQGVFNLKSLKDGLTITGDCVLNGYPNTMTFSSEVSNFQWEGKILNCRIQYAPRV